MYIFSGIKTEGVQIKNESSTSPYMDGKEGYNNMPSITLQNQSINPVSINYEKLNKINLVRF